MGLNRRIQSFKYAFRGLAYLFSSQWNARFHLFAAGMAVLLGYMLNINTSEWCWIVCMIGLVLAGEALNTALEATLDALHPEHHPLVGKAKDVAAGAVLLLAFTAILVGMLIFVPKLTDFF